MMLVELYGSVWSEFDILRRITCSKKKINRAVVKSAHAAL